MPISNALLARLRRAPILADGAMGTMLYARGISFDRCFDELNLSHAPLVQEIHRAYLRAGAEIIETNTFGANRFKLAHHGLESKTRDINLRGVKIAREAREVAGRDAFVFGAVGPLGHFVAPLGAITELQAHAAFKEQIEALLEGGVDAIIIETMSDLNELKLAIAAARAVTRDLPLIAQMSFIEDEVTLVGNTPEEIAAALRGLPVDVIGTNCSVGPAGTFDAIKRLVAVMRDESAQKFISVMPNAGFPTRIGERYMYVSSPQYFAEYVPKFVNEIGATIIGGCCGTTPDHIAAMRNALNALHPTETPRVFVIDKPQPTSTEEPAEGMTRTRRTLREKLNAGKWVTSVEIDPPRGLNPAKALQGAMMLKQIGVDCINIADSPLAKVRMDCISLAVMIQQQIGLETIIHFTTRDRNLMALQSQLIGAHTLGIRNVLALTGDPPRMGDYPNATAVYDIDSIGLIQIIKKLNEGHDWAGTSIGTNADFMVACALDMLWANSDPNEIDRFHRKLQAGADLVMTQPIYDAGIVRAFLQKYGDKYGKIEKPILLGVLPLMSTKHAEFLHNEVPGITLTDEARRRMKDAGEHGIEEGIKLAQEALTEAKAFVAGAYLMPSFGRYEVCGELVKVLQDKMSQ